MKQDSAKRVKRSPDLAAKICAELALGRSIRSITKDSEMPGPTFIFSWLAEDEAFAAQYARAREEQAEALVEEMLEIADDASNDWMESNDPKNPGWSLNGDHVQRSKLRIDARKWYASKLKPRRYGDKVEHTGEGGGPIRHSVGVEFL